MNWYKQAGRGNIPRMEGRDQDPYRKSRHGDGTGWDMLRPGDEDAKNSPSGVSSGLGTRFRDNFPDDFSQGSEGEYGEQRKDKVPESSHALMEAYRGHTAPEMTEVLTWYDEGSPLLADKLNNRATERVGPHNQHRSKDVFQTVRARLR